MAKKHQKNRQQQFLSPDQFMRQRMRSLEIGTCYVSDDLTESGEGHVVVTRRHTGGRFSMAMYLVDIYCIGVKDSFFRLRLEEDELNYVLDRTPGLRICSYEEAHNWVYGAIAWAEEAGIVPDRSFDVTKFMLEEDTDEVPLIENEFGKDGKHLLVADDMRDVDRYLPLLEGNLGAGNFEYIIKTDFDDDTGFDFEKAMDRLKHIDESPLFKRYGPSTEYTYHHPAYPQSLALEGPEWLYSELRDTKNALYLSDELTTRILALPREIVRHDLERIILYNVGQTCDGIPDDYDPEGFNGIIANCVILLGEVGSEESSLDVVLEVMRQSDDFRDYHIADAGGEIFVPTLYLLGQNRLDVLMDYIKEEGLDTFFKCFVFSAVSYIALVHPERRGEVIEWFREAVRFATETLPKTQWIDSDLSGLMLSDLLDIQAKELLPEIQRMFDTGIVDLSSCGDFASVSHMIANPRYAGDPSAYETDVYRRFADMKRRWEK